MTDRNDKYIFGPDNPHPLSTRKTELIWEGKYDEYGNRREVDIAGMAMPMQKIETIDEPASRLKAAGDQLGLDLLQKKKKDDFRNMLIWGDNKLVMASLLKDFKGKIDMIYIDPPFFTGTDQKMAVKIGVGDMAARKERSLLEEVAYRNIWGLGSSSFCHWMYELLSLMKVLLTETGMIFIRFDQYWSHYVKVLADDIFLKDLFQNEIVVNRIHKNVTEQGDISIPLATDVLLLYFNSKETKFHEIKRRLAETRQGYWRRIDDSSGVRNPPERTIFGKVYYPPAGKHFKFGQEKMDEMVRQKKIRLHPKTGRPQYWVEDTDETILDSDWTDIPGYSFTTGYPTENSEELLDRVIRAGTSTDTIVADFFCGSGTTGAVAEQLGRRWIMADLGRFAIHTSRKRLIELQRRLHDDSKVYRAFDVYNLGRYERQWWQKDRLKGADEEHRKVLLGFYKAELLTNARSPLLHGRKGPALVHVDGIDSMLSRSEVRAVASAAKDAGAKEVHCLAWEFEMDLRLVCNEIEHAEGIKIKLIPIPREIMEKNRTSPPPFLEVAILEAQPVIHKQKDKRTVDIKLTKFLPSLAEVPSKELEALRERAVKSGFDFIDFWAVDFDYEDGQPFEHHWQAYRTRKDRSLPLVSSQEYTYLKPGRYTACVKVVDVFGCDTSITVEVNYE
jgi:hypothetical protein